MPVAPKYGRHSFRSLFFVSIFSIPFILFHVFSPTIKLSYPYRHFEGAGADESVRKREDEDLGKSKHVTVPYSLVELELSGQLKFVWIEW